MKKLLSQLAPVSCSSAEFVGAKFHVTRYCLFQLVASSQKFHCVNHERVSLLTSHMLNNDRMHRLFITVVSRLVLNLRAKSSARAVPSSVESEQKFQTDYPVARPPQPSTSPAGVLTAVSKEATGETAPSDVSLCIAGPSRHAGISTPIVT